MSAQQSIVLKISFKPPWWWRPFLRGLWLLHVYTGAYVNCERAADIIVTHSKFGSDRNGFLVCSADNGATRIRGRRTC
jgi:hypothetical protein